MNRIMVIFAETTATVAEAFRYRVIALLGNRVIGTLAYRDIGKSMTVLLGQDFDGN